MKVESVPTSISRQALSEMLASLGLDTKWVRSVRIDRGGIYAEVIALNDAGKPYAIGNAPGLHTIAIPIEDTP